MVYIKKDRNDTHPTYMSLMSLNFGVIVDDHKVNKKFNWKFILIVWKDAWFQVSPNNVIEFAVRYAWSTFFLLSIFLLLVAIILRCGKSSCTNMFKEWIFLIIKYASVLGFNVDHLCMCVKWFNFVSQRCLRVGLQCCLSACRSSHTHAYYLNLRSSRGLKGWLLSSFLHIF